MTILTTQVGINLVLSFERRRCGCNDDDPDVCRSDEDPEDEAYVCDCDCHEKLYNARANAPASVADPGPDLQVPFVWYDLPSE